MIKKLTEKIKLRKGELVKYDFFDKDTFYAGDCPDCGEIVAFSPTFNQYLCLNPECSFEADINKERTLTETLTK